MSSYRQALKTARTEYIRKLMDNGMDGITATLIVLICFSVSGLTSRGN